jgi:hypothetical protein
MEKKLLIIVKREIKKKIKRWKDQDIQSHKMKHLTNCVLNLFI